jgi:hypothetical protein
VHNWPCPAALDEDELDRPGYTPTERWRYAHGSGIADDDPLGKKHQTTPDAASKPASPAKPNVTLANQTRQQPCPDSRA